MLRINNKKITAGILSLILFFVLAMPAVSFAANAYLPLIQCGNDYSATNEVTGENVTVIHNPCDFNDFIETVNRVINWIISLAVVIFTISAIYGGFLYMMSGVNEGNKSKAKGILWNTLIGFVIILTAWLIVYTILTYLVPSNSSIFRFLK